MKKIIILKALAIQIKKLAINRTIKKPLKFNKILEIPRFKIFQNLEQVCVMNENTKENNKKKQNKVYRSGNLSLIKLILKYKNLAY